MMMFGEEREFLWLFETATSCACERARAHVYRTTDMDTLDDDTLKSCDDTHYISGSHQWDSIP